MELDKKQTLVPSYKVVSLTGIQAIHNYIMYELGRATPLLFPLSWSWEWLVTQGEHRGKLPTRLAHMVKTRYDVKLTPAQKSEIGNIARKHLLVEEEYIIDFTEYFNWFAGDFGDRGSCFWGENSGARQVMEEEGVIAIRFYDENGGRGRAWLYELSQTTWILFNAYGLDCSEAASVFAMELTEETGDTWEYEQLECLAINGTSRGLVYINSSPQIIYKEGYDRELYVDLDWDIPYDACPVCGEWAHLDELYYNEEDEESLCERCYEKLQDERDAERLAELEEIEAAEFMDNAARAEIAHTMAQETIRQHIYAQVAAGQLNLGAEYQVNLFYG